MNPELHTLDDNSVFKFGTVLNQISCWNSIESNQFGFSSGYNSYYLRCYID